MWGRNFSCPYLLTNWPCGNDRPMRALLDTHALLWWFADDPAISPAARRFIGNSQNTLVVSAASAWEIATKVRLGRLPTAAALSADFAAWLRQAGFQQLPILIDHAIRAG